MGLRVGRCRWQRRYCAIRWVAQRRFGHRFRGGWSSRSRCRGVCDRWPSIQRSKDRACRAIWLRCRLTDRVRWEEVHKCVAHVRIFLQEYRDILEHLRAGPRVCQKMCGAVGANRRTFLNCGEALPAGPHRRFALAMMFRISSYTVTSSANRSCTQRHADHARSRHSQRTPSECTFIRPIRP